ncbi:MAG: BMP family ABC transporter substrate-binding protein [Burkholderiales bacterium]
MTPPDIRLAPYSPTRRQFLAATAAAPFLAACEGLLEAPERGPIAAVFLGRINDGDYHEQGYRGLQRVRDQLRIPVQSVDRIGSDRASIMSAMREVAQSEATMIVVHGAGVSDAVQRVAWEFPRKRFTIIQGDRLRPNLAIYRMRGEQSAWLAGAAAGLLTKSGVVGHAGSGPRADSIDVHTPFAAGVRATNAKARVLEHATLDPIDSGAPVRTAWAYVDVGADVLFVTGAATPAIAAAQRRSVRLIGQGRDWVAERPDAFAASAVADNGAVIVQVGRDLLDSVWRGDLVRHYGLRYPDIVRLAAAPSLPPDIVATLEDLRGQVASGRIPVHAGPSTELRSQD